MNFMTGMTRIMETMLIWYDCDNDRANARFAIWPFGYGKSVLVEDEVRLDQLLIFRHFYTGK